MTASALNGQLPQNIGSTGGLLNSAETEEKYAITWTSSCLLYTSDAADE